MSARAALHLGELLLPLRDPATPVAFRGAGAEERVHTFADFREDVAKLGERIAVHASAPGARFALYHDDPYAFGVGLFALWQAGCVAVLPPNAQPGSLDRLRDAVEGAVGASASWLPGRIGLAVDAPACARGTSGADCPKLRALDREAPALELFTSGTTGEGKVVPKLLRHLDDEVQGLDATFGDEVRGLPVFATASHQHLYGLLFRVLWPLATGRAFCADRLLHAAELLPRLRAPAVLASVPAHLDRLAEPVQRAATTGGGGPVLARVVFSSGGPLSDATAHVWERATGSAPVEIFGSTETGGVGWRRQQVASPDPAWVTFAGVEVSATPARTPAEDASGARLFVRSPFVSVGDGAAGEAAGFEMGDTVHLEGASWFRLAGRGDRVLKVGEKRLSLPDMESRLRTHRDVEQAALVGTQRAGQTRVGAVVVLSESGRARLAAEGRRAMAEVLSKHLARDFDRVLIPRAWRYVDALPEDAQGKTTASALGELFEAGASAARARRPRDPDVLAEERGPDFAERRCRVPADLAQLEGHFPGAPMVAGVVQVGWAVALASELAGRSLDPERVEALKFAAPLEPGADFSLRVELDEGDGGGDRGSTTVRFRLFGEGRDFSSGRFRMGFGVRCLVRPCALIPVYEHGAEVGEVLKGLAPTGLRCLVVDDGSGPATRAALDELARANPWIHLHRRAENGGRGAALRDGYRLAGRLGFTHVVQLDADGQHDPRDVGRLLDAARARPDALVLGRPIFDASAPALRLHSRKLSQWLVWLETLSLAIRDPLCGFRCFPLRATLRLIDRTPMGDRMDFDPEIAVRLQWAGLPVVNVPTQVVYREGGISHYDVIVDTWLIARAHARLVAGMLVRAPLLLGRRIARRLARWRVASAGTAGTTST